MYTTPVNFRANYAKCWWQANNFKQSWSCEILVLWKAENANTTFKRSVATTLLSHDHFSYIWHTLRATFMINQDSVASSLSKLNNWWKSGRIHVYSLCFYVPKRRSNCIGSFKVWSLKSMINKNWCISNDRKTHKMSVVWLEYKAGFQDLCGLSYWCPRLF